MNINDRPTRVLMVCTGSIYRSMMAHTALEQAAAHTGVDVIVDSAGVSDEEQGDPVNRRAARVLHDAGYTTPDHHVCQIHAGELGEWGLILAMILCHLNALECLAEHVGVEHEGTPASAAELGQGPRVCLYRDLDSEGSGNVPDPWCGGHQGFLDTLEVIEWVILRTLVLMRQARGEPTSYADKRSLRVGWPFAALKDGASVGQGCSRLGEEDANLPLEARGTPAH